MSDTLPGSLPEAIPDRTVRHRLGGEDVVRFVLVAVFAAILYLFVLYPLIHVIWRSLLSNDGAFVGLANYRRYFGTPAIAASIGNSLVVSLVSMAITVILAFVYAYGLTRTRMPCRGLFRVVAMLPLFAPSLVQALAFIYVFGNNGIITRTTGFNVGIYGPKGIIFAEVFYCFPHALLILIAALSATAARLSDAAPPLGASPLKTFLTVTLPGVKFGLVSACFVVFTLVITDFGAPKAIGRKCSVMATEISNQVSGQQNFTMGATVSVVLLIPAVLAFLVDRMVQRRQYALVTASSRALSPRRGPVPGDRGLLAGGAVALQLHADAPALRVRHGGRLRAAGQQRLRRRAHRPGRHRARLRGRLCGREVPDRVERPPVPALRAAGVHSGHGARTRVHLRVQRPEQRPQRALRHSHDPDHLQRRALLHGGLPDRHHRAAADGRRIRERLRFARRPVLSHLLAGDRADGAALDRGDQHVLLPERDGHALRGGIPGRSGHRAGRGGRAPDGRRRRHRTGRRDVGLHHHYRVGRAPGILGPPSGREPSHRGLARPGRKHSKITRSHPREVIACDDRQNKKGVLPTAMVRCAERAQ